MCYLWKRLLCAYFPCGSVSKDITCNVGDLALIPGSGRSGRLSLVAVLCRALAGGPRKPHTAEGQVLPTFPPPSQDPTLTHNLLPTSGVSHSGHFKVNFQEKLLL